MPYCYATQMNCHIESSKPKSCIECIYIKHYGAEDMDNLHRKIIEMFDSLRPSKIQEKK